MPASNRLPSSDSISSMIRLREASVTSEVLSMSACHAGMRLVSESRMAARVRTQLTSMVWRHRTASCSFSLSTVASWRVVLLSS
ncbi:hypothetical protein D9M68_894270 [compost metagenome]